MWQVQVELVLPQHYGGWQLPGLGLAAGVVVKGRAAASTHHTRVSSSVLVRKVEGVSCCTAEERKVSEGLEQYS